MTAHKVWYRKGQDKKEIDRIGKYNKADIARAIIVHDGKEVTPWEIARLVKYRKAVLCAIFHDDHYGKEIIRSPKKKPEPKKPPVEEKHPIQNFDFSYWFIKHEYPAILLVGIVVVAWVFIFG